MNARELDLIAQAIREKRTLTFMYDNTIRIVEPHALGTSVKDGRHMLRAFQTNKTPPAWGLFSVEKMVAVAFAKDVSVAPRPGYARDDRQMRAILAQL